MQVDIVRLVEDYIRGAETRIQTVVGNHFCAGVRDIRVIANVTNNTLLIIFETDGANREALAGLAADSRVTIVDTDPLIVRVNVDVPAPIMAVVHVLEQIKVDGNFDMPPVVEQVWAVCRKPLPVT